MEFTTHYNAESPVANLSADLTILGTFSKTEKKGKKEVTTPLLSGFPKELKDALQALKSFAQFKGAKNTSFSFDYQGHRLQILGLGEKKDFDNEALRKTMATLASSAKPHSSVALAVDHFLVKGSLEVTCALIVEAFGLSLYHFDKYLGEKDSTQLKNVTLITKTKKAAHKKVDHAIHEAQAIVESVNIARSFVNEPPNVLNSVTYAKAVMADIKGIKGVKGKVLGKADLKKMNMEMFLSVNAGSAYEPQLVHLTYTPSKATKNTKHIALVGKGLTFDTGGYSLKPATSMVNMKFDMAGSATVYGAFRAVAKLGLPVKVSCFLGMTDNAVNSKATMPDSIVKAKNGKTVEILNTDAEGRLVLGDVLTYASEQKPDAIIDAATLTGACLVALGTEVCGLMGNDDKLKGALKKAAASVDEYIWELPIVPEWRKDMKSQIADLKNIGGSGFAGTAKAAAFLENFVAEGIPWAHLDIAGVGDSQAHLPYCPKKGASGLMIRTLVDYLRNC